MRYWLFGLVVYLLSISTVLAQESPEALQAAFVNAMIHNDVDAIVALYAPDATLYPPAAMEAKGRDAIRQAWTPLFESMVIKEGRLHDNQHETHGDTAIAWGRWTLVGVPKTGGDPVTMEGRFLDVAKKINGKWLYVVDHASMPLPPPPKSQ